MLLKNSTAAFSSLFVSNLIPLSDAKKTYRKEMKDLELQLQKALQLDEAEYQVIERI